MNDQFGNTFREEAKDLLTDLEAALLELESDPDSPDIVGRAFRALHTIKGSGAMFGFDEVAHFTHDIENAFDRVRNGHLVVTGNLIDLTLTACDHIRCMIGVEGGPLVLDEGSVEATRAGFRQLVETPAETPPPLRAPTAPLDDEACTTWRIRFRPAANILAFGTNPLRLLGELRELGPTHLFAHTDRIPPLEDLDPETCCTGWDLLVTTSQGLDAVKDVFMFVEGDSEVHIELAETHVADDVGQGEKKLGEILVERGELRSEDVGPVLKQQKKIGELLVESGLVSAEGVEAALTEQQHLREVRQQRQGDGASSSLRVPADKLDALVNMVGELVTVQSRLNQLSLRLDNPELTQIGEEVERLTAELRDTTMSIRMLPIGTTFQKFSRLLRDLARELGKNVTLETRGGETELDKTVIERLNDPLVHLIRNAIDHGIESPAVRLAAGKPEMATVKLAARHEGANVTIEISDDGAGIDVAAVRQRGVDHGIIAADANLSEREIFSLIFAAGFSTSKEITKLSGRGVGLDVVKRAIETMGGAIEIDSTPHLGTTFRMKLPLTLAIIDGLLVKIAEGYFVLPLANIEECVELTQQDGRKGHGQNLAFIRGELVPYVPLRRSFGIAGVPPPIEQIVTARVDGSRVGFVVDQVVGQHQTVIKSLGRVFRDVDQFSGATILGDGTVALIMDVPSLLRRAERDEQARMGGEAVPARG